MEILNCFLCNSHRDGAGDMDTSDDDDQSAEALEPKQPRVAPTNTTDANDEDDEYNFAAYEDDCEYSTCANLSASDLCIIFSFQRLPLVYI